MTEAGLTVDARGLTKWFGETTALDGVDFAVGNLPSNYLGD